MIIINARFLTQNTTGVQRFAIEICRELIKSDLNVCFVAPVNILNNEIADEFNVKKIGFLTGHLWEQITLQIYVKRKKAILLSLCNTAPLFLKKQIITIHDLSFKLYPEWNSKIFSLVYNTMIPIIAHNSKHILTVSNSSKEELINELNISKEKISVVYNAVSPVFLEQEELEPEFVENKEQEDFILTVSSFHPRKNLTRLIRAFLSLPDKRLKLYIVGNFDKNFAFDKQILKELDVRIKILTGINDLELKKIYKAAKLFVFPSLYEGFGIPLIEAMSCGTPVCVSNLAVFKEVCGSNAIYFNPRDIDDMTDKIKLSIENPKPISNHFKRYSWKISSDTVKFLISDIKREKKEIF